MFRLIRFLFLLVITLLVTLYLLLLFVDLNHFKEPIERELTTVLNRPVTVERINLSMSLVPSVDVRGVTVHNLKEFDEKTVFAKVAELNLSLAILPLFKGVIQVDDILVNDAKVFLTEKDGKNNWSVPQKTLNKSDDGAVVGDKNKTATFNLKRIQLQYISLKNITVSYTSDVRKETFVIQNASFSQMKNLFMHFQYNNEPIQITLASEDMFSVLLSNRLNDFAFNLKMKNMDANVAGTIGNISDLDEMDLTVNITADNVKNILAVFSADLPKSFSILDKKGTISFLLNGGVKKIDVKDLKADLKGVASLDLEAVLQDIATNPKINVQGGLDVAKTNIDGRILQPINATFHIDFSDKVFLISDTKIFIDKSDIELGAKIDLNQTVPMITGQLFSKYFNMDDMFVSDELSASNDKIAKPQSSSKKTEEFDLSFLKALNANIVASFSNLKLFDGGYHKASLGIKLKDGIMSLNPISFDLLSGNIVGQAVLNAETKPLSVQLSLNANGVMLSSLNILKPHLKDTPADMVLQLTSKGNTEQTLLENLNGQLQVQMPKGVIVNKWFNSLPVAIGAISKNNAFSYSGGEYYSKLSCASLNLKVKDGLIHSDKNIALETSLINLVVSGDIDLKKKYLSLSLIPSINQLNNKLNKKLSFAQYVKLQGPFNKIEMKEDVKGALNAVADKKLEKLAEKVTGSEIQKEELIPVGGLCRKAMGEEVVPIVEEEQVQPVKKQETKKEIAKEIKNSLEEQVKSKLEKSLSDILKKK